MTGKAEIDSKNIPAHVAVIMDGNGRWAKQRGGLRVFGHQSAITAVRETVEEAAELGVQYMTLYAFSTENWNRPELAEAMELTKGGSRMTLLLALSYSGRWDITQATQRLAADVAAGKLLPSAISEATLAGYLATAGIPDPELLIRTSGEQRISNFLLWQLAYTELYITDLLWPDFRRQHFREAIKAYQRRERRFGKTSEQLAAS